ncbi:MAG: ABC transporter substrate-binding protein [Planctomycetota bacterium]|nr:MAG: ABC transporter substrate-binding protein [Planctomycetota bacterium]
MLTPRSLRALASLALLAGTAFPALAGDPGVSTDKILLGQACALKGQASSLGKGMRAGLNAYFNRVNKAGGINGRIIELKSLDDGYEPDQSKKVTEVLIDKIGVFSLIGAVGTPTSSVTVPMAKEAGVPFIAPFTGAGFLRDTTQNSHVVNVRASYDQEMERLAQYLVDQNGLKNIACFYQNDGYGKVGLAGIEKALAARGMKLVSTGTYERNTVAIASGLNDVAAGNPDAVVMVGAYSGCAEFIKAAKSHDSLKNAVFCNISFVGTDALQKALGSAGEGVIISQVVPFPWDTSLPIVADFHEDMKAAGETQEIGFISLEGYIAGRMFCDALAKAGAEPTREGLLNAFHSMSSVDYGGITLTFGQDDNQGLDQVFLTRLTATGVEPIGSGFANVSE